MPKSLGVVCALIVSLQEKYLQLISHALTSEFPAHSIGTQYFRSGHKVRQVQLHFDTGSQFDLDPLWAAGNACSKNACGANNSSLIFTANLIRCLLCLPKCSITFDVVQQSDFGTF